MHECYTCMCKLQNGSAACRLSIRDHHKTCSLGTCIVLNRSQTIGLHAQFLRISLPARPALITSAFPTNHVATPTRRDWLGSHLAEMLRHKHRQLAARLGSCACQAKTARILISPNEGADVDQSIMYKLGARFLTGSAVRHEAAKSPSGAAGDLQPYNPDEGPGADRTIVHKLGSDLLHDCTFNKVCLCLGVHLNLSLS